MELKEFQLKAVKSLFEAMDKPARDIILKSPTGSGKTIILLPILCTNIYSLFLRWYLCGSHRVRAILKNRARRKWINISTLRKQNSLLM